MNMDRGIMEEIDSNASTVDEFILSHLEGQPKELYQASTHYIVSGGKRLRPFMVIKSCQMFGGNAKMALPPAAAVELIHNFSLVHDDIMDNDEMRHSVMTVHKQYGIPVAILAGDILFSKAFQLLVVDGKKVGISENVITEMVAKLSTACIHVCEGQAADVYMTSNSNLFLESEYIDMISKKTAALFELSCTIGTLSAERSTIDDLDNLSSFGKNVGIAFQLIDDLIGVLGDPKVTGKAVGNDIREGKKTYPILLAIKNTKSEEKNKILKVFGTKNTSAADLEKAVKAISDTGIQEQIRQTAKMHIDRALKSIQNYTDTDAKKALECSANFIIDRRL